jgi:hypothetical protein
MNAKDGAPSAKHRTFAGLSGLFRGQMVNVGFPRAVPYGFEMVHGRTLTPLPGRGINQKFTPNQSGAFFREFSAN